MAVTLFHTKPTLRGYHFEDWSFTFVLASGITASDIGKAVSIDTSAANKVKLAADGDFVLGRLASVEDRTVEGQLIGAVELKFANILPIKSGETVAVGDTVIGAGSGEVKTLKVTGVSAPDYSINFVAEIQGSNAVVVKV